MLFSELVGVIVILAFPLGGSVLLQVAGYGDWWWLVVVALIVCYRFAV